MKIIGFNFKKINGERLGGSSEEIKIETGISILDIKPFEVILKAKEEPIEVNFEFSVNYNPDLAKIAIFGTLIISVESKIAKEILKEWKNKKIPEEFKIFLFNNILKKSTIRAIQLEDELHLPIHINLPKITTKSEETAKTN